MYWCQTELFGIELFICIKMDLALNNLQRLICHKIKPNQRNLVVKSTMRNSFVEVYWYWWINPADTSLVPKLAFVILSLIYQLPSRLGLQNTLTASLQRGKTLQTSVLDMSHNNLQWGSSSARVLENVKYPGPPGPEWLHLIGSYLQVK